MKDARRLILEKIQPQKDTESTNKVVAFVTDEKRSVQISRPVLLAAFCGINSEDCYSDGELSFHSELSFAKLKPRAAYIAARIERQEQKIL